MTNKESIIKLCNKIEELEGVIKYYEERVKEWENQNNDLKIELSEIKEKIGGVQRWEIYGGVLWDDHEPDNQGNYVRFEDLEKIIDTEPINEKVEKALNYAKLSFVDDSHGLPAMLLGDVVKLIEITTGKKLPLNDFTK